MVNSELRARPELEAADAVWLTCDLLVAGASTSGTSPLIGRARTFAEKVVLEAEARLS